MGLKLGLLLAVQALVPACAAWWAFRPGRLRIAVVVGIVLSSTVAWSWIGDWRPAAAAEVVLLYPVVAAALIFVALIIAASTDADSEFRARPRARAAAQAVAAHVALVLGLGVLQFVGTHVIANPPSRADLGSLPAGVDVGSDSTWCGSSGCVRRVELKSSTLSSDEVYDEILKQWPSCRPRGWIIDRRMLCLEATRAKGDVVVSLSLES
jgi:hypothetical protein